MNSLKSIARAYWPTMIVLAVVLYATLASHPVMADDLPPIPYLDKLIHAVMMGGLLGAFIFDWQRAHRDKRIPKSLVWSAFAGIALFGVADELFQAYLTSTRSGDPLDFIADVVGSLIAVYTAPPAVRYVLGLSNNE